MEKYVLQHQKDVKKAMTVNSLVFVAMKPTTVQLRVKAVKEPKTVKISGVGEGPKSITSKKRK